MGMAITALQNHDNWDNALFGGRIAVTDSVEPKTSGTPRERKAWLKAWCLENPNETVRTARAAVMHHFDGHGIGNAAIMDIMREARAEVDGKPSQPILLPAVSALVETVTALTKAGLTVELEPMPDGHFKIIATLPKL